MSKKSKELEEKMAEELERSKKRFDTFKDFVMLNNFTSGDVLDMCGNAMLNIFEQSRWNQEEIETFFDNLIVFCGKFLTSSMQHAGTDTDLA